MRAALLLLPILLSIYLHSPLFEPPPGLQGLKYTDIAIGVFVPVFVEPREGGRWFNSEKLAEMTGGSRTCPLPYLDYHFEYPPLVGLLWLLSTCLSIQALMPHAFPAEKYGELMRRVGEAHYYLTAAYLLLFYLLLLYAQLRLSEDRWRPLLLAASPSMYVFSVYNWDVPAIALFLFSLYVFEKRRYELAGALAGLSVSVKLLTAIGGALLAAVLLREGKRREALAYSQAFLAAAVSPFLFVLLMSPQGFSAMISHHASWYCENCIYMVLVRDIWSNLHRVLAALFIGFLSGSLLTLSLLSSLDLRRAAFAAVAIPVTFGYVFSPQMMVLLTPLAVLSLPTKLLPLYMAADAVNALALLSFFNDSNPWTLEGVTQKLFMIRNAIAAGLVLWTLVASRGARAFGLP